MAATCDPLEIGSLSHGGGIMCHAIHAGLYREGLDSRLVFANEIRPELLDHARETNDFWESDTVGIAAPMQKLAFDRWAMAKLPGVDILEAGIPCSGASLSGRSKRKLGVPTIRQESQPTHSRGAAGIGEDVSLCGSGK